jgi:hypothetical protein
MDTTLRIAALVTASVLLVPGCAAGSSDPSGTSLATASTAPSSPSSSSPADPAARLEGVWRSQLLSRTAVEAALRKAGLQEHTAAVLKDLATPEVYSLSFAFGTYSLTWGSLVSVDSGRFELEGTHLRLVPHCTGCGADFEVTIEGSTLRLDLVSDTSPPVHGVPDAAFLVALYESSAFTRA